MFEVFIPDAPKTARVVADTVKVERDRLAAPPAKQARKPPRKAKDAEGAADAEGVADALPASTELLAAPAPEDALVFMLEEEEVAVFRVSAIIGYIKHQ